MLIIKSHYHKTKKQNLSISKQIVYKNKVYLTKDVLAVEKQIKIEK